MADASWLTPGAGNRLAKANRDATCRVRVPVEALMAGTPSRTARVSVVRRNLKEAEGKLPARGTRTAYEATSARWARGRIDPKPDAIRTGSGVYAAGMWEESRASYPERSAGLPSGQARREGGSMSRQKSAEAIVVAAYGDEGPNGLNRTDAEHSMPESRCRQEGCDAGAHPEDRRRNRRDVREVRIKQARHGRSHVGDQEFVDDGASGMP